MKVKNAGPRGRPTDVRGAREVAAAATSIDRLRLIVIRRGERVAPLLPGQVRITLPEPGRPIRSNLASNRTKGVAFYPSVKSRVTHATEGQAELLLAMYDEVSTETVARMCQPCAIEAWWGGRVVRTIPDALRVFAGARRAFAEAKADWDAFEEEDAVAQVGVQRIGAILLGLGHDRIVPASLGDATTLKTIKRIQLHRTVLFSIRQELMVRSALETHGEVAAGRLAEAMEGTSGPGARSNGMARLCAMMVRRMCAIDLSAPFGPDSAVRPVPVLPFNMPGLRLS